VIISTNLIPSLEILPVEILYRIFDNLDTRTIFFSVRLVCRLFQAVVNTYHRYDLNLKSASKSDVHVLCRSINPQNIVSLTLSDSNDTPGQVELFLGLARIRQFTRLRSLTLHQINESDLTIILKPLNIDSLSSFSINIQKYDERRVKTTMKFLSSIITLPMLHTLDLHIRHCRVGKIVWPMNCTIQHCTIQHCTINTSISFDEFRTILKCSPHLRTFIVQDVDNFSSTLSFK
jgi:hypothetical protein